MISVDTALNTILQSIQAVSLETLPLSQCLHRVLAETVISTVNVPSFANSAMDGYAIIAADSQTSHPLRLKIIANIPAGVAPTQTIRPGTAARIMTGAPMPMGADAVIRFEDTSEYIPTPDAATDEVWLYQAVSAGDNVRLAGEDIQAGQVILAAGHELRPQDIGVLAAIGQANVTVYRRPRVAILATGDELVDLTEAIAPGKIRNSNEYTQAALVQKYGGEPLMLGIARDTVADLTAKIRAGLAQQVDLFLTSAGVSVGDFDVVKDVLAAEGEMQFWQVAIKPGKPLAFGLLQGTVPLIGLPGNPVAAMVAFEIFARPAILKLRGLLNWDKPMVWAQLDEEITNSGRRHYMRASVWQEANGYHVTTRSSSVRVQGSAILTSLVWANGLVVVPETVTYLPPGSMVQVWLLD